MHSVRLCFPPKNPCKAIVVPVFPNVYLYYLYELCNYISLSGDSAGGNLAAAITLTLRDEKFSPALKAQVLMYPVTQSLDHSLLSYQQNGNGPILTRWDTSYYDFNDRPWFKHILFKRKGFGVA